MDLRFNTSLAEGYKSASQIARVLTEDWLARTNPSRSIEYSQERQESGTVPRFSVLFLLKLYDCT